MEKIVIFIIIMIASSYFSNKKKKATFTKKKNDTTFFDDKGNKISESRYKSTVKPKVNSKDQPQSMSEALNELKNIFTNPAQNKPMSKPEPAYETNYGEVSTEANNSKYSEKDYREKQIKYETQNSTSTSRYKSQSIKKEEISDFKPIDDTSYAIKTNKTVPRKDVFTNLFHTKNQLKKAVIMTEVFNKKY